MALANPVSILNASSRSSNSVTNSYNFTTSGAATSGSRVVVSVMWESSTTERTLTVSGGSLSWAEDEMVHGVEGSTHQNLAVWSAVAPSGLASGSTLTFSFSGNCDFIAIAPCYFEGGASSTYVDASPNQFRAAPNTTWASTTAATSNANDLLMGFAFGSFNGNPKSSSGQQIGGSAATELIDYQDTTWNLVMVVTYRIVSATGTYGATGTWNDTPTFADAAIMVAYKEAAGGTDATVTGVVSDAAADSPAGAVTASAGTDDFETRANGTLDAPWTTWTSTMPTVASGEIALPASGIRDATYAVVTDSADSSMTAVFNTTLSTSGGNNFGVGTRLTAHSGSANGYMFEINNSGGVFTPTLYRGSGFTTIATGSTSSSSAIDGIRITAIGTTISGYFRISSVWTLVVQVTDATYSAAGYAGFWTQNFTSANVTIEEVSWGVAAAGSDANVTAVPATVAGDAPAGVLSAGSSVTAVPAVALGQAPPANQMISSVVNAPAVVVTVDAPAGTTTGSGGDATVTGVPAVSAGDAPAGVVSADSSVTGVPSTAAGDGPAGTLAAGSAVGGVPGVVNVDAPRPTISPEPEGGNEVVSLTTTFAEDFA